MSNDHPALAIFRSLFRAQQDFDTSAISELTATIFAEDCTHNLCAPFGTVSGADGLFSAALKPLASAFESLERRDYILIAGEDDDGEMWVGAGGYYTGNFVSSFLDIPATGRQAALRYHEFYRIRQNVVVETQIIWDLPALMIATGVWPMAPSLGVDWQVPAPSTQDGLDPFSLGPDHDSASKKHIVDMLAAMVRHPLEGGPEVMEMPKYWHEKMNWYGPGGIGTARGIKAFRDCHQIPFLSAMPDRGKNGEGTKSHFFAQGDYVAVTGWPNMSQTLSGGGWLGLPPTGQNIKLRSLDFWRIEEGKIRENWVLVDLIDMYTQVGVDVFGRLREFNKTRIGFDQNTGEATDA